MIIKASIQIIAVKSAIAAVVYVNIKTIETKLLPHYCAGS